MRAEKMSKKVNINNPTTPTVHADTWVKEREGNKTLTVTLPISLHTNLKITAAKTGKKMSDIVQESLNNYLNDYLIK